MEHHGHLDLDPAVRTRLLSASAATLDRLLKPIRPTAGSRRRRRRRQSMGKRIPVCTYNDWDRPPPGFLEIDLVAHCGGPLSGSFIHSLVATDICTGWTEAVPLLAREQSLVVAGLEAIGQRLPFPVLGIDSDNDSAFINETLVQYCADRGIEFTRSRAYRSNDQAWIEQKNGSVVRRFIGHERYSGQVAGQTMAYLYEALRLYVNFFQPSFKLIDKTRDRATTVKRYSLPITPCDRLIQHEATGEEMTAVRQRLPAHVAQYISAAYIVGIKVNLDGTVAEAPVTMPLDSFKAPPVRQVAALTPPKSPETNRGGIYSGPVRIWCHPCGVPPFSG